MSRVQQSLRDTLAKTRCIFFTLVSNLLLLWCYICEIALWWRHLLLWLLSSLQQRDGVKFVRLFARSTRVTCTNHRPPFPLHPDRGKIGKSKYSHNLSTGLISASFTTRSLKFTYSRTVFCLFGGAVCFEKEDKFCFNPRWCRASWWTSVLLTVIPLCLTMILPIGGMTLFI
jgi:hypothetical protein